MSAVSDPEQVTTGSPQAMPAMALPPRDLIPSGTNSEDVAYRKLLNKSFRCDKTLYRRLYRLLKARPTIRSTSHN
jgi:hypothetical protein